MKKTALSIAPAGPEGGMAMSDDSVWLVTDNNGTLLRIDPSTNSVRQKISLTPGSYDPVFSDGIVWITGIKKDVLNAVDASTGKVLESIDVGPKPRFVTAGILSVIACAQQLRLPLIAPFSSGCWGSMGHCNSSELVICNS